MKLYTEEQVRIILNRILCDKEAVDEYIDKMTPIELPSDKEIYDESPNYDGSQCSQAIRMGFRNGAKWMRDKIKGGEQ